LHSRSAIRTKSSTKMVEGTGVEPAYVRLKAGCSAAKPTLNKTMKINLAGATGIEPATSGFKVQRSAN
jgi:hypothetical protein